MRFSLEVLHLARLVACFCSWVELLLAAASLQLAVKVACGCCTMVVVSWGGPWGCLGRGALREGLGSLALV